MSRKPDWSQHVPDERFAPYRDRVARLMDGQEEAGLLLVTVEPYAKPERGRLGSTRWTYSDLLRLRTKVGGTVEDNLVHADLVGGQLRDYDRGLFRYHGKVFRLEWVAAEDAERLRVGELGDDG